MFWQNIFKFNWDIRRRLFNIYYCTTTTDYYRWHYLATRPTTRIIYYDVFQMPSAYTYINRSLLVRARKSGLWRILPTVIIIIIISNERIRHIFRLYSIQFDYISPVFVLYVPINFCPFYHFYPFSHYY